MMANERGKVSRPPVIRDPAIAVSVGKCWLYRWSKRVDSYSRKLIIGQVDALHRDEPCGFCDYPADYLIQALEEFAGWAGMQQDDIDAGVPFRPEVEAFVRLPEAEQRRLVYEAQYDDGG